MASVLFLLASLALASIGMILRFQKRLRLLSSSLVALILDAIVLFGVVGLIGYSIYSQSPVVGFAAKGSLDRGLTTTSTGIQSSKMP